MLDVMPLQRFMLVRGACDNVEHDHDPGMSTHAYIAVETETLHLGCAFLLQLPAALRIAGGVLVVVDCVKGLCAQSETAFRQALGEWVSHVLTMTKVDQFSKMSAFQFGVDESKMMKRPWGENFFDADCLYFSYWSPVCCVWDLLLQRPPWSPPVWLSKLMSMAICS
jgi:hypothetical protein